MAHVVVTTSALHVHRWFRWSEFSSGSIPAPLESREGIHALVDLVLVPLRHAYGPCTISSGFRTEAHNKRVGGAHRSHHRYEQQPLAPAVDVRFARGRPADWAERADRLMDGRGGIGTYKGHVHLDRRDARSRWFG